MAATLPATAPEAAPKSDATTTVNVTGKKKDRGREVYDVTKDPGAKTGTAAEALNKIPGVNVDSSGNVTLHGRNAVVYLNGRPSLMLSGDNRGVALKAMPSAYISTIEVISNPGAQYASDGGAPIININTQRKMPPGMFGSVSSRYNSPAGMFDTAFLGITRDRLELTLIGSYLGNRLDSRYGAQTRALDSAGALLQASTIDGTGRTTFHGPFLSANVQYDAGPNDVLAAALSYNSIPSVSRNLSHTAGADANGITTTAFDQSGTSSYVSENGGLSLNYTHYGQLPDETLKIDGSVARTTTQNGFNGVDTYAVPLGGGMRVQANDRHGVTDKANLHGEYNRPVGDDQLTLGAEVDSEDKSADSQVFGPANTQALLAINPLLSDDFRSHQTVSALYVTWQRELSPRWTVLAGLRGETLHLATSDLTYGTRSGTDYSRLNPSLFATFAMSPERKLRFSLTHRQQRPEAADINPHVVYASDTSVNAGNPDLKPQESDQLEARYEFSRGTFNYAVRGFLHSDSHAIASVSRVVPDPQGLGNLVIETRHVNWRGQSAGGLSANVSRQIAGRLTFNASFTVTRTVARSPQTATARQGTSLDGDLSLDYNFKGGDRIMATYKVAGTSFTGQGYTTGAAQASLQYSRKLTPKIDLELTVNDLFRQTRTTGLLDTPFLNSRFVSSRQSPTFMIGLSRRFMRFDPVAAPGG